VVCTRKTTPGLRAFEKYAVRCGGGFNHRFALDDGILIKDNHIVAAGGVTRAIQSARAQAGHMIHVEIEVDSLAQMEEALNAGANSILLDNMSPDMLREAVKLNRGRALLEASGNINTQTIAAVAATGVNLISSGAITHSAKCLDVGLDFQPA
jgi:nicotinate-nucleotide pyrophosphorylase (carboxylating)